MVFRRILLLSVLNLIVFSASMAQEIPRYSKLIEEATKLYQNKDYLNSGKKFSEAFSLAEGKYSQNDRYNAACIWALANRSDSAFILLFDIANNGKYSNLSHLKMDADLISLHHDKRWIALLHLVELNKEAEEASFDKALVKLLDSVYLEDQKYRRQSKAVEAKYGLKSDEMLLHREKIKISDSINLVIVKNILDYRGWLGADSIGKQGNQTLFLVIQHSDLNTQEKYLPMMREAVKKGNARASSLAMLEDRVAIAKGEKQIYGTQIGRDIMSGDYYVLPMIDPENIDTRRGEIGLGTIQEYLSNWNLVWSLEAYKTKLVELETRKKN